MKSVVRFGQVDLVSIKLFLNFVHQDFRLDIDQSPGPGSGPELDNNLCG